MGWTILNFLAHCGIMVFSILTGAEGELWAIEGGNHVLAEKLFTSSGANRMQENVRIFI